MALSEIEKLERRYAENPQGLTFAPLAEVHRKNGEVQRALDLLGPGLALHPDYIPASIVLGRCHLDLGDVHAAERAFLHVLALDGENVIALKSLADISERLLKFEDAERWLQTLLSLDRSNDEAREQLQQVETSRRQAEVDDLLFAIRAQAQSNENRATERSGAGLAGKHHAIKHEHLVAVLQRSATEGGHCDIERLGDLAHRLGADRSAKDRQQRFAYFAGRQPDHPAISGVRRA